MSSLLAEGVQQELNGPLPPPLGVPSRAQVTAKEEKKKGKEGQVVDDCVSLLPAWLARKAGGSGYFANILPS